MAELRVFYIRRCLGCRAKWMPSRTSNCQRCLYWKSEDSFDYMIGRSAALGGGYVLKKNRGERG